MRWRIISALHRLRSRGPVRPNTWVTWISILLSAASFLVLGYRAIVEAIPHCELSVLASPPRPDVRVGHEGLQVSAIFAAGGNRPVTVLSARLLFRLASDPESGFLENSRRMTPFLLNPGQSSLRVIEFPCSLTDLTGNVTMIEIQAVGPKGHPIVQTVDLATITSADGRSLKYVGPPLRPSGSRQHGQWTWIDVMKGVPLTRVETPSRFQYYDGSPNESGINWEAGASNQ